MRTAMTCGIVLFCCFVAVSQPDSPQIAGHKRSILLDGILTDWQTDARKAVSGDSVLFWDAANTDEGLAGYCILRQTGAHRPFAILLNQLKAPVDSALAIVLNGPAEGAFYRVRTDSARAEIQAEWLVRWEWVRPDSAGAYRLALASVDSGKIPIEATMITGSKSAAQPVKSEKSPLGALGGRIGAILVLIILFFAAQGRSKKKKQAIVSSAPKKEETGEK